MCIRDSPAAHPERHLHHGEPGPRGVGSPARLRVPLHCPPSQDPRRYRVDGRSGSRHLKENVIVPATMQALVVLEPNKFEIQEVPAPTAGPNEVLALSLIHISEPTRP